MNTLPLSGQIQPLNPNKSQRQAMAYNALLRSGHPEDYSYIAAALAPPPDITTIVPPGSCKGKTVGVIGGGLAGMAAAFELRKAGFDITVFEANGQRLGGRVFTHYFDREKKLYGELGAMRLPAAHETVWHYIDLFGLDTRPFVQVNPNAFIYLNGVRVRNDLSGTNVRNYIYPTYNLSPWEYNYNWQQLGYLGLEAPILKAPPEVRQETLHVLPQYSPYTLYLDALDIRKAMEQQGLSQGAISMLSNLFPIAGRFLYNNYIDIVQEYYPADFVFMYEISGGMVKLPEAFCKSFRSSDPTRYYSGIPAANLGNVSWNAGITVTGIYQEEPGNQVTLAHMPSGRWNPSFGRHIGPTGAKCYCEGVSFSKFDYVICAIPFSVLRGLDIKPLFSELKMQAIREVTYSPAQKAAFRCRRRFWEDQGIYGGGSYTDLPINTIWYPSSGFDSSVSGSYNHSTDSGANNQSLYDVVYNPSSHIGSPTTAREGVILSSYNFNMDAIRLANLPENRRDEKIKKDVEKVHGLPEGTLDSIVTDSAIQLWDTDPFYRGTFCYFTPQQKKLFSWNMTQPEYNGRIFFAGEHISAIHRWQQGALDSGMIAASAIATTSMR